MTRRQEIEAQIAKLTAELQTLPAEDVWPVTTGIYLHGSKDSNDELAQRIGLIGAAEERFRYCCLEVALRLEVNRNGSSWVTHFTSLALPAKVRVS